MNYGSLPFTGASVTIGGVILDQIWLAAIGVGLVLVGAVVIKLTFRRGKAPTDV